MNRINFINALIFSHYRLVLVGDNGEMFFLNDKSGDSISVNEKRALCFDIVGKEPVFLDLDQLSVDGTGTRYYNPNQGWGWELGVGRTWNNYIARTQG